MLTIPGAVAVRHRESGLVAGFRAIFGYVFSFETAFFFFLYSNAFNLFIPKPPIDETVIMMGVCFLIGGWIVLREGLYRPGLEVFVAWILFLGWIIMSLSWTPAQLLAKDHILQLATFDVLCFFGGGLIVASSRERVVRMLVILLIGSLFFSFYGIGIYLTYGSFRFNTAFDYGRLYLLWGYAASAGGVIAYTIMLYSRFGSVKQITFALLFAITLYFLLIASGRGPLLSTALPCLVPLLLSRPLGRRGVLRMHKWQISALLIIAAAVIGIAYLLASGFESQTLNSFTRLLEKSENANLVRGANRLNYYPGAIRFWLESPIIGNGVVSFSVLFYGNERPGAFAHNIILEILSSYGFVGIALFSLLLWTGLRHASWKRISGDPLFLCVFLLFLSRFISAQLSVDLPKNTEMFTYLAMLTMRPPAPASARSRY